MIFALLLLDALCRYLVVVVIIVIHSSVPAFWVHDFDQRAYAQIASVLFSVVFADFCFCSDGRFWSRMPQLEVQVNVQRLSFSLSTIVLEPCAAAHWHSPSIIMIYYLFIFIIPAGDARRLCVFCHLSSKLIKCDIQRLC